MKVKVGAFSRLSYHGQVYHPGEVIEIPDKNVDKWLANGLVLPADPDAQVDSGQALREPLTPFVGVSAAAPPEALPADDGPQKGNYEGYKGRWKVCPTPRCPERIPDKDRGCAEHRTKLSGGIVRKSNQAQGRDARWYAASRRYLRSHPVCGGEGCADKPPILRRRATEVHHLDGLGPLGPRGYDPDNWLGCCKPCHSRYTARETGFGRG